MKQSQVRAMRVLGQFTNKLCSGCKPKPYACCEPFACEATKAAMESVGLPIPPPTGHPTLRFMGENGCVVPWEYRPGCTGFVCQERVADRKVWREWRSLERKAFEGNETVFTMLEVYKKVAHEELVRMGVKNA